jgi:hypothetical protein
LILASYLYQRFVRFEDDEEKPPADEAKAGGQS